MKREPSFIDMGPEVQPALTKEAYDELHSRSEQTATSDTSTSPAPKTEAPVPQVSQTFADQDWMLLAECVDFPPGTFFPADGAGVEVAKKICAACVVKEDCLEYAISNKENHGVWGGTSERERRRILKRRAMTHVNIQ